mgnify:FL=1
MEYLWISLAALSALIGLLGSVLPVLPGPPLSYAALWMMWINDESSVSMPALIIMGVFMLVVTILDYIGPIWMTKIGGGSKMGTRGAMAGLLLGMFFGPLGMIVGPFAGALVGELLSHSGFSNALRAASFSFLAFILTIGLKLIYCIVVIAYLIYAFV